MSPASAEVHTQIDYLLPSSRINRRFWAPGKEYNTGLYASYPVTVRNARLAGPFTLHEHGFCIGQHHTHISDWAANYGADSCYAAEVGKAAMRLCGADVVVPMGGMLRSSGLTSASFPCPTRKNAHVLSAYNTVPPNRSV